MQILNSSEIAAVSGAAISHMVIGVIGGASAAAAFVYLFPAFVGVIAGGVGGALIGNSYAAELDSAWASIQSVF